MDDLIIDANLCAYCVRKTHFITLAYFYYIMFCCKITILYIYSQNFLNYGVMYKNCLLVFFNQICYCTWTIITYVYLFIKCKSLKSNHYIKLMKRNYMNNVEYKEICEY